MNLGVVIVSYEVRDLLRSSLVSLYADAQSVPDLTLQVVVVDNHSQDGSAEMVVKEFPQVTCLAEGENHGFAAGNNLGLRHLGFGRGEGSRPAPPYVLLLNPDTALQPGALAELTGFLDSNQQVGGCCARLNYGDGEFQHSAFRFPGLTQLFLDLFPLHPRLLNSRLNGRYPRELYDGKDPFAIDFALGAALMVRAEVISEVGLLDEGYFMYAEEVDWQWRMQRAGWPLYCVPTARITHYEGRSTRQFRANMTVALWRSRLRYYDLVYPRWKRAVARELVDLGMRVESKRVQAAYRRREIDATALDQRLQTYQRVRQLCRLESDQV